MKRTVLAVCLCALAQSATWAKIDLPDIFSDNMVLQQQTDARIWGWSEPGAKVTVGMSWSGNAVTVDADKNGKWTATVKTPAASYAPQTLTIADKDGQVKLSNVLIGEVWFCSGQSNMEMPLAGFDNCPISGANEVIATSAQYKGIRMATVEKNGQLSPVDRCQGKWKVCNPENSPRFSATAFFFARMVNSVLDVPVGIINCSWGGTMVEGWLPRDTVAKYPDIDLKRDIRKEEPHDWWHYLSPTLMYNGMLRPLEGYTIKGFLWYQGESNVGKHKTYAQRLKTMVDLWRKEWGQGELPFYFVEIAPFGKYEGRASAFLREAQYKAQSMIVNSAMVSTNDLVEPYEAENVHPKDKRSVGSRLAYQALAKTYGVKGIEADCPAYQSMEVKGDTVVLSFVHADNGFNRMKGMEGFEVAGADREFYPAKAELLGKNQIVVVCDKVSSPVSVRYAFHDYSPGNVANLRGLPLVPFRTDDWDW